MVSDKKSLIKACEDALKDVKEKQGFGMYKSRLSELLDLNGKLTAWVQHVRDNIDLQ